MPVSLNITIEDRGVRKLISQALRKTGDLTRPFSELGLYLVREAGRRLRERPSEDMTGALRASLTFEADKDSVTVGSNLVYAAIQQLGGEVHPRPPHNLAIPLQPHLRRRHVWPSDLAKEDLKFGGYSMKGNPLLRYADGGELAYVLVEEVTVPANPYIVFDDEAETFLERRLIRHLGLEKE